MEQIFLKILNMSITASYCALAVMVLRLLLKRLPKIYSYALWLIVAFRLVCPVSFESVFSLMRVSTEAIPVDIAAQEVPEVSTGIGQVDVVVNKALTVAAAPAPGDSVNPLQIWLLTGSIVWLLVAAGFLVYGIGSYLKMRMELKGAKETEPGVFVSEVLKTPFVLGFLHPVIYLPEGLSGAERDYVLEHERTHIHRWDPLVKLSAFLLMCVYWFNPVLWLSYYLMCKDMEMSCDEKVIKKLSADHAVETKKDYASTLLALASNHLFSFGGPLAFGEGNIKKRIANVLQYKKLTMAVSAVLVVAVAVAVFVLVGNPKKDAEAGGVPGGISPLATPTATPTPPPPGELLSAGTPTEAPEPTPTPWVYDTSDMTLLAEENGVRYYYGVITEELTENGYFTLELPSFYCMNEICYLLELVEQPDGIHAVQNIEFYLAEQLNLKDFSPEEMAEMAKDDRNRSSLQLLEGYHWTELKDYLEKDNIGEFVLAKQAFAVINQQGTGGYRHVFPLDMILEPDTLAYEKYKIYGAEFKIRSQLTIHSVPQTVYNSGEMAKYLVWQQESLGTELKENVYYAEIHDCQVVTPYFELWVPEECVDKVSYVLTLKENADGTKAVSSLQYYYAPVTELKADYAELQEFYISDYFEDYSWFGSLFWDTVEGYLDHAFEYQLLDWAKRSGSVRIRDLEPYYLQESAPVGRSIYWANAEGTGAYFYQQPSDVQWRQEFEEEYLKLHEILAEEAYITFFAEPEAVISEKLWNALVESAGLE